jgi:hypothetical protein
MKSMRIIGVLGVAVLALAGCEDITNPVEEFGTLADAYVRFQTSSATGTPASLNRVILQQPTRVTEDVTVTFTFGGDAVFGEDFLIVDEAGNVRTDVTAAGGTALIPFDSAQTQFARDTIFVFVPFDATDGRTLEIAIESAVTESGRAIETGYIDAFRTFDLSIEGFVDIPTGTYAATRSGDFGGGTGTVTITKPASPIVIDGTPYDFLLSDSQGDAGVFSVAVPWAFSVTSGGTVVLPSQWALGTQVTADVVGTFDFATNTLSLDLDLTCCGAAGFGWSLEAVLQ